MARARALPPPASPNRVTIECYGLTMARGGGWMAFCGAPRGAAAAARVEPSIVECTPNMTGFHVLELSGVASAHDAPKPAGGGKAAKAAPAAPAAPRPDELALASCHTDRARFNIYGKTDQEVARFAKWVKQLPRGRVVCICITDTAVAAKRPPGAQLYEALGELGAPAAMEKIGYRFPFAMLGAKGLPRGEAIVLMDKTKFLLRIDATVARGKDGAVTFEDVRTEKTDITTKVILSDGV